MKINNSTGGQELLCINTRKVYDWVLNEATFDVTFDNVVLPILQDGTQLTWGQIVSDSFTCEVSPATFTQEDVLDRVNQTFIIDGREVDLQIVTLRKTFTVTIYANLIPELGGGRYEIDSQQFSRCEQVILCAPTGTDIDVSYTDVDCFVCNANYVNNVVAPGQLGFTVTVRLCQSIQSTFDVTLEIEADFCEPRGIFPFPPCPAPIHPPQCPVVFPNNSSGTGSGGKKSVNG